MKKNIFAFIIAASLGFMSCEDFIEHEKRGVQDLDNYFKTDTECRDFVIDLYKRALLNNDWQPIAHTRITNETATDDAWMGNTGQSTDGFSPASEYLITPNRMGYLTDLFKERYKNIMACNIAINSIPEAPISEDKKKSTDSNSSRVAVSIFSFRFSSLYFSPLVLKNFRIGSPLAGIHAESSCAVGFCSVMSRASTSMPFARSHLAALMQVPHFG